MLADRLSLSGGMWDLAANLDLNLVGYFIAGLFVLTWAVALAIWRFGRIEERWSAHLQQPSVAGAMTIARAASPLDVRDLDDVAAAVREAGGRLTAPRRAVWRPCSRRR